MRTSSPKKKEERERVSRGVGTTVEYKANVRHAGVNTESVVLIRPSGIALEKLNLQPKYLPRRRGYNIAETEYEPEELAIQWSSVPGESLSEKAEKKLKESELKEMRAQEMMGKTKDMQKRLRKRQRERARERARRQKKNKVADRNGTRRKETKPKKRYKAKAFVETCTPRFVPRA